MKQYFLKLLKYNLDQNLQILGFIKPVYEDEFIARNLCHILNVELMLYERVYDRMPKQGFWDTYPWESLEAQFEHSHQIWAQLAQEEQNEQLTVRFKRHEVFLQLPLSAIYTHIVNHGTHHRAVILQQAKTHGLAPIALDYMRYLFPHYTT